MIDRKKFFDGIRSNPFPGSLSPEAVWSVTAILNEWDSRPGFTDLRWLAYMLATVLGECGQNMMPVREGFKKTDAEARVYVARQGYRYAAVVNGHVYYGRGLVQLTWHENYKNMGTILGIDLAGNPDKALEPKTAAAIMFEGMRRGTFTKKKLADYFNAATTDWHNARRIINALDRAAEIAGYARAFYAAIVAAEDGVKPPLPPTLPPLPPVKPPTKPPVMPPPAAQGGIAAVLAAIGGALSWFFETLWPLPFVAVIGISLWLIVRHVRRNRQ